MSPFNKHLPPRGSSAPRKAPVRGKKRQEERQDARYQSARRLRVPHAQPAAEGLAIQRKGPVGKGTDKTSKEASRRRRKSDTYPHIAGSCTALSCVSALHTGLRTRGAGVQRASHGRSGRVARVKQVQAEFQDSRWRGAGVRDLGDRLTEERYNACGAATPTQLLGARRGSGVAKLVIRLVATRPWHLLRTWEMRLWTGLVARESTRGLSTRHKREQ